MSAEQIAAGEGTMPPVIEVTTAVEGTTSVETVPTPVVNATESTQQMNDNRFVAISSKFLLPVTQKPAHEKPAPEKPAPEKPVVVADNVKVDEDSQPVKKRAIAEEKEAEPVTTSKEEEPQVKRDRSVTTKMSLKQRHADGRPSKGDRLCSFLSRGEICPFDNCEYSHDVFDYLNRKPEDISGECYLYKTYGFCSSGLMCRFGSSHIDKTTGKSLVRSAEEGGVIERVQINVLSKDVQVQLRKKSYDKNLRAKQQAVSAAPSATSTETPAAEEKPVVPEDPVVQKSFTSYPEKTRKVDFRDKVYVAPLTTVGNLPFRRILKEFGADITCGEMSMASNIESGQASEWALLRRHPDENIFGVQLAGNHAEQMGRVARIIENEISCDFVDLNAACPIDVVANRGSGSGLLTRHNRLVDLLRVLSKNLPSKALTVKVRIGWDEKNPNTHKLVPLLQKSAVNGLSAIMIHGRSRLQRYHKLANWDYVLECAKAQDPELPLVPIIGNGDILTLQDWQSHRHMLESREEDSEILGLCNTAMLARGALMKPWLCQEIKEGRTIDISASERLDMLKRFCNYGLDHWGSDSQGVAATRRFLLEWMSFLHRYVPAGLTESPQRMHQRPPPYFGRCDLETLLSSPSSADWIKISEMLLGPVPEGFSFVPKHKTNSYAPESARM